MSTAPATHIVRSVEIELRCRTDASFNLANDVSNWAQTELAAELEQVFNRFAPPGPHRSIDRIELVLDAQNQTSWRKDVLQQLRRELALALAGEQAERPRREPVERSARDDFGRKLLHYLQHGWLLWSISSAEQQTFASLAQEWLDAIATWTERADFVRGLQTRAACARLSALLSETGLTRGVAQLIGIPESRLELWLRDWVVLRRDLATAEEEAIRMRDTDRFLETLLRVVASGELDAEAVVTRLVCGELARSAAPAHSHERAESTAPARSHISSIGLQSEAFVAAVASSLMNSASPAHVAAGVDPELEVAVDLGLERNDGSVSTADALRAGTEEAIYLNHAGVVLLAPFLPTLFHRLGLAGSHSLEQPGVALALIHFLCTGQSHAFDYQLPLAKIFCGIPLPAFVAPEPLTDVQQAEATQLLHSAIDHWSVLKSTSVATLQESFLQRPGRLTFTEEQCWHLCVEQRAFDLLLQHVPWNFALIRLPWMRYPLKTDWVH